MLVFGGRDFGDLASLKDRSDPRYYQREKEYTFIFRTLDKISMQKSELYTPNDNWLPSDIEVISGMATGVDSVAFDWAACNWLKVHEFPANWKTFRKGAGWKRNQQMIDEGRPDFAVGFPGGTGTADMALRCKIDDIELIEVEYVPD
jgi:hypothetical protein